MTQKNTPETAWYLFSTHGDCHYTRTVKGLEAVHSEICNSIYVDDAMQDEERESWREWLYDFDGSWCMAGWGETLMPWNAGETFEDGSFNIQRIGDDDPILSKLNQ